MAGEGSQWPAMGRELLANSAVFRRACSECDEALRSTLDWSVLSVLRCDSGAPSIDRPEVARPVLFTMMVALAALWRSWGVEPDAVVGYSLGEIAAAYIAGALALDQAAKIVAARSRLLSQMGVDGAMASLLCSEEELNHWLRPFRQRLTVAAYNGPRSYVVSGDASAIDQLLLQLEAGGVFAWKVGDHALHSSQVERIKDGLYEELSDLCPQPARIPLYSTMLGKRVLGVELDANYWYRNLREPVLFAQTLQQLLGDGHRFFVEATPRPVLSLTIKEALKEQECFPALSLAACSGIVGEQWRILVLGELYCRGDHLDLRLASLLAERHRPSAENESGPSDTTGAAAHPISSGPTAELIALTFAEVLKGQASGYSQ